jgi:hypothetical protein
MSTVERALWALAGTAVLVLGLLAQSVRADVMPGDVIDQSNYPKIEGWVPDFLLQWVKVGDLTMRIGERDFDPAEFWPQEVKDNRQANIGRYRIDEHNGIVDGKTGEPVRGIQGLPFPEPDPNDPTMPLMLMWSNIFAEFLLQGATHEIQHWLLLNRSGLEKTLTLENLTRSFDPAKSEYDYGQLTAFRSPFNISGIGTLALYCLYPMKNGIRYAYTPELKRMKRLSHRVAGSEVQFGEDYAPDDSWVGGPKTNIEEGVYRFLGEKDALVPYLSEHSRKIDRNEKGELEVVHGEKEPKMQVGFEVAGWKGAPWHIVNITWVKSKVYVLESRSKDPNYSYGPCEGWVEKGSLLHCYKRVTDVNGTLWKGAYYPGDAIESQDGRFRLVWYFGAVVVDMRRDHGTAIGGPYRKGAFRRVMVRENETLFTKSGFAKFIK